MKAEVVTFKAETADRFAQVDTAIEAVRAQGAPRPGRCFLRDFVMEHRKNFPKDQMIALGMQATTFAKAYGDNPGQHKVFDYLFGAEINTYQRQHLQAFFAQNGLLR